MSKYNFVGIYSLKVRHFGETDPVKPSKFGDTSHTEYQTGNQNTPPGLNFSTVDFVEYFNITRDNWHMMNLWHDETTAATQRELHTKLHTWFACSGDDCE